jgi:hypothetical protein
MHKPNHKLSFIHPVRKAVRRVLLKRVSGMRVFCELFKIVINCFCSLVAGLAGLEPEESLPVLGRTI